jgi:hypothetical protein
MNKQHSTTKAQKFVNVLFADRFKQSISCICFTVKSSSSDERYSTCFNGDSQHASCSCPATRECYHITQFRERAAEYFVQRMLTEAKEEREEDDFSDLIEPSPSEKMATIMEKAQFSTGQAFSILR